MKSKKTKEECRPLQRGSIDYAFERKREVCFVWRNCEKKKKKSAHRLNYLHVPGMNNSEGNNSKLKVKRIISFFAGGGDFFSIFGKNDRSKYNRTFLLSYSCCFFHLFLEPTNCFKICSLHCLKINKVFLCFDFQKYMFLNLQFGNYYFM